MSKAKPLEPEKSKNHVAFVDGQEFFLDAKGTTLCRADIRQDLLDGVRADYTACATGSDNVAGIIQQITGKHPRQLPLVAEAWLAGFNRTENFIGASSEGNENMGTLTKGAKKGKTAKAASEGSGGGGRARIIVDGIPITGVIRWAGANGFSRDDITRALMAEGIEPNPSTVATQIGHGRGHAKGDSERGGPLPNMPKDLVSRLNKFKTGEGDRKARKAKGEATEGKPRKAKKAKAEVAEPKARLRKGKKAKAASEE